MAGIAKAKATYARKIQGHFTSNDPGACGRALNASWTITPGMHNAQGTPLYQMHSIGSTLALRILDTPPSCIRLIPPFDDTPLSVSTADVRRTLKD